MLAAQPLTLDQLDEAPPAPQPSILQRMRDSHHGVARLMAMGTRDFEISSITGYAPATLSRLRQDPAFSELIEYYRSNVQAQSAVLVDRLTNLAGDVVQEIHQRLVESPDEFSPSQLNDLAKAMLDRIGFGPSKTVNSNNLSASITPEDLARIRAQAQQGGVRRIGQSETQTISLPLPSAQDASADRGPEGSPASPGETVVHSPVQTEGKPSPGVEI